MPPRIGANKSLQVLLNGKTTNPTFPGGADVHHLIVSRATRDALYLALSGLIRDGVIDERRAIDMGRGVLRENARRLHGWK